MIRTGIIEPDFLTLGLPMLVRSMIFVFFVLSPGLRDPVFAVLSSPYPREGISEVLARGSIIPVLTVVQGTGEGVCFRTQHHVSYNNSD